MYDVEGVGIHGFSQMGSQGAQPCLLKRPSFSTSCAGGPVSGALVPFVPRARATTAALLASDNLSLMGSQSGTRLSEWTRTEPEVLPPFPSSGRQRCLLDFVSVSLALLTGKVHRTHA